MSRRRKSEPDAPEPTPEEQFVGVHRDFTNAISDLIDDRYELMSDGSTATVHARLSALMDSVEGRQGNGGRLAAKSLPPLWLPAVSLVHEIETTVSLWPHATGATTVDRLASLTAAPFGPPVTDMLVQLTRILKSWAQDIDALLEPESVKTVSAACPACGATHVYRRDDAGETVRKPALQIITSQGCTCLACHTSWGPHLYQHLAKVLECPTPEGVVA